MIVVHQPGRLCAEEFRALGEDSLPVVGDQADTGDQFIVDLRRARTAGAD